MVALQVTDMAVGTAIARYRYIKGSPPLGAGSGISTPALIATAGALSVLTVLPEIINLFVGSSTSSGSAPAIPQSSSSTNAPAEAYRKEEDFIETRKQVDNSNDSGDGDTSANSTTEKPQQTASQPETTSEKPGAETTPVSTDTESLLSNLEQKKLIRKKYILQDMQDAYAAQGKTDAAAAVAQAGEQTAATVVKIANIGVDLCEGGVKALADLTQNLVLHASADLVKNSYIVAREFIPEAVQAVHDGANAIEHLVKGSVKAAREYFFNWAVGESLEKAGAGSMVSSNASEGVNRVVQGMYNAHVGYGTGEFLTHARQEYIGKSLEQMVPAPKNLTGIKTAAVARAAHTVSDFSVENLKKAAATLGQKKLVTVKDNHVHLSDASRLLGVKAMMPEYIYNSSLYAAGQAGIARYTTGFIQWGAGLVLMLDEIEQGSFLLQAISAHTMTRILARRLTDFKPLEQMAHELNRQEVTENKPAGPSAAKPQVMATEAKFCYKCGAGVHPGQKFCGKCGASLSM